MLALANLTARLTTEPEVNVELVVVEVVLLVEALLAVVLELDKATEATDLGALDDCATELAWVDFVE